MTDLNIDIDEIAHLPTEIGTLGSIGGVESGGDDMFEYLVSMTNLSRQRP